MTRLTRRQFLQASGLLASGLVLPRGLLAHAAQEDRYQVALAQATTYDRDTLRAAVAAMLDDLGGLGDIVRPGDRVAIKTNLTGGSGYMGRLPLPAADYYMTHPAVVDALCAAVRDAGAGEVFIVEAAWDQQAWRSAGYVDLAQEFDAVIVDLNTAEPYGDFVEMPVGEGGLIYDSFTLNGLLSDVDAFMSVAKLKTHASCGVTLAMKNLVGITPLSRYMRSAGDGYRTALHGAYGAYPARLPRVVVDLVTARPIDLALIDGIKTAQAGEGPWIAAMSPITANVLVAGKNPVATDAVATAVMGFDPETEGQTGAPFAQCDNHLALAAEAGLGSHRLADIDILGAALDEVQVAFEPAPAAG